MNNFPKDCPRCADAYGLIPERTETDKLPVLWTCRQCTHTLVTTNGLPTGPEVLFLLYDGPPLEGPPLAIYSSPELAARFVDAHQARFADEEGRKPPPPVRWKSPRPNHNRPAPYWVGGKNDWYELHPLQVLR